MDLIKELKKINIENIEEYTFNYCKEKEIYRIPYIAYTKKYDNIDISRYYFFNFDIIYSKFKFIYEDYEEFRNFQDEFLSRTFFNCNNSLKYNLYIVNIISNNTKKPLNYNIDFKKYENNLEFSRKLFLNVDELDTYFNFFEKLEKSNEKNKYKIEKVKIIKDCIKALDKLNFKAALVTNVLDEEESLLFLRNLYNCDGFNYDKLKSVPANCDRFFEKYFYNEDYTISKKYNFIHINKIFNRDFRKKIIKSNEDIYLKKFNLIYGNNSSGKTSFLEMIEYSMTGTIHRKSDDAKSNIIIESNNHNEFNSNAPLDKLLLRKSAWYPQRIGTLNDLFCKINYFDINAAYNFAIEYNGSHLDNFLCDIKLIELSKNLDGFLEIMKKAEYHIKSFIESLDTTHNRTSNLTSSIISRLFHRNKIDFNIPDYIERYNYHINTIKKYISAIELCKNKITELIDLEMSSNINNIDIIYKKLYSLSQDITYDENTNCFRINNEMLTGNSIEIDEISTAQKVCLALSVIISQFFAEPHAPKFILLDEAIANFDPFHILNLFDFLRELVVNDIQIVFTTASNNVVNFANNKFNFLGSELKVFDIDNKLY